LCIKTKFVQICGIDDAGRGSMLGPLVIAGISIDKKI
jgi:ribonuclease HII